MTVPAWRQRKGSRWNDAYLSVRPVSESIDSLVRPVCISMDLFVHLSVFPFDRPLIHLSVHFLSCVAVHWFFLPSNCPLSRLSVRPSSHLPIFPSCLSIRPLAHLSVQRLICPSISCQFIIVIIVAIICGINIFPMFFPFHPYFDNPSIHPRCTIWGFISAASVFTFLVWI